MNIVNIGDRPRLIVLSYFLIPYLLLFAYLPLINGWSSWSVQAHEGRIAGFAACLHDQGPADDFAQLLVRQAVKPIAGGKRFGAGSNPRRAAGRYHGLKFLVADGADHAGFQGGQSMVTVGAWH